LENIYLLLCYKAKRFKKDRNPILQSELKLDWMHLSNNTIWSELVHLGFSSSQKFTSTIECARDCGLHEVKKAQRETKSALANGYGP
jgi:hypothetical protein